MSEELNYLDANRESWNRKTPIHLESQFYDHKNFLNGKSSLNSIELDLLDDISGKKILHLQCHFGQDTISLSRLGAEVVGVDLSDVAIDFAKAIAKDTNSTARFICCDLYSLDKHLEEEFDIVYTSYGTIGWLPDLDKWANIVSKFLKPDGKFVFVEFHPIIWMYDDNFDNIIYKYSKDKAIVENFTGTYAEKESTIPQHTITWNHGLSEVFKSLLNHQLEIINFDEIDYSPYNCFNNTYEFEPGKFRIKNFEDKVPMVYTIVAKKKIQ